MHYPVRHRPDRKQTLGHAAPFAAALADLDRPNHTRPALVDDELIAELAELENLAPSHAGPALPVGLGFLDHTDRAVAGGLGTQLR